MPFPKLYREYRNVSDQHACLLFEQAATTHNTKINRWQSHNLTVLTSQPKCITVQTCMRHFLDSQRHRWVRKWVWKSKTLQTTLQGIARRYSECLTPHTLVSENHQWTKRRSLPAKPTPIREPAPIGPPGLGDENGSKNRSQKTCLMQGKTSHPKKAPWCPNTVPALGLGTCPKTTRCPRENIHNNDAAPKRISNQCNSKHEIQLTTPCKIEHIQITMLHQNKYQINATQNMKSNYHISAPKQ